MKMNLSKYFLPIPAGRAVAITCPGCAGTIVGSHTEGRSHTGVIEMIYRCVLCSTWVRARRVPEQPGKVLICEEKLPGKKKSPCYATRIE